MYSIRQRRSVLLCDASIQARLLLYRTDSQARPTINGGHSAQGGILVFHADAAKPDPSSVERALPRSGNVAASLQIISLRLQPPSRLAALLASHIGALSKSGNVTVTSHVLLSHHHSPGSSHKPDFGSDCAMTIGGVDYVQKLTKSLATRYRICLYCGLLVKHISHVRLSFSSYKLDFASACAPTLDFASVV
ncbi:hypothetical protein F5887DRAFT_1082894 [Amanita rubescens]|nr:hypothetical protein F5887DRAFT_1082894 [Amanita rubescens]